MRALYILTMYLIITSQCNKTSVRFIKLVWYKLGIGTRAPSAASDEGEELSVCRVTLIVSRPC